MAAQKKPTVAVATDSNSGITQAQGTKHGIGVIPMPFLIDGTEYFEDVSITREEFFQKLEEGADVQTSQPSPESVTALWDKLLEEYEEVVYIPMSGGLSNSVQTALMLSESYEGRVQVVDNHRISCSQKQSVLQAVKLAREGWKAAEIKAFLLEHALDASIYIAVDTLKYAKVRGMKLAQTKMLEAVKNDIESRFAGEEVLIKGAYTCDEKSLSQWKKALSSAFPKHKISLDPLALSISCHIGAGSMAVVCMKIEPEADGVSFEL